MSSDVVLSAALRNNLLSLQSTQKGIDNTQLRLSTGKKVNSALDNPQSFFAAQALTNRASDLTKLLDGIGQSIQVIKAADNGVTALTSLVNSAQAIATSAQDAVNNSSGAQITGTVSGTTVVAGVATNNDTFDVTSIDANGVKNKQTITLSTTDTVAVVAAKINQAFATTGQQITSKIDSNGFLSITGAAGTSVRIDNIKTAAGAVYAQAAGNTLVAGLGLSNYFNGGASATANNEANAGGATASVGATINAGGSVISSAALTSNGSIATLGTKIKDLNGFTLSATAAQSQFQVYTDAAAATNIDLQSTNGLTVQGFIDKLNTAGTGKFTAAFDSSTGKINITITDATVKSLTIANNSATTPTSFNFGFGSGKTDNVAVTDNVSEVIAIPSSTNLTTTLSNLQTQYNAVRSQIDALVTNGDTAYRGTNLLNGNNLVTTFNENRTSSLTTKGVTFNSSGLGLAVANFSTAGSISTNLTQVQTALGKLRDFGTSIAGDLSTIQTRQDFTNNIINTLTTGSDALVNADQNEEGAKLLALQTRQSLGVTALSLASQSQQSILRLFG